jgi:hypothetical protein
MLEFGHFGKKIRNIWKVLKCGVTERWRTSVGPIAQEMQKCYEEKRKRGTLYKQYKEGRLTGLVTSSVGTAF